MAPVGRWQKGKDLNWYAKGDDSNDAVTAAEKRKEEIRKIKEAEEDARLVAMGLPPRNANANLLPLGDANKMAVEPTPAPELTAEEKELKRRDKERRRQERRERKERHRRSDSRDKERHKRRRSRSRSRDRDVESRRQRPRSQDRRKDRSRSPERRRNRSRSLERRIDRPRSTQRRQDDSRRKSYNDRMSPTTNDLERRRTHRDGERSPDRRRRRRTPSQSPFSDR
jgi:hypothetical protein